MVPKVLSQFGWIWEPRRPWFLRASVLGSRGSERSVWCVPAPATVAQEGVCVVRRPPSRGDFRQRSYCATLSIAQEGVCIMQRQPLHENACVFCSVPPSHCVRSDPRDSRRAPQRVAVTLPEFTFGCADHRRGLCFATRPLRMLCIRPDPRVWTTRPPEGGCYAAKIHVWVRFLLPRTTISLNANHRSQESA